MERTRESQFAPSAEAPVRARLTRGLVAGGVLALAAGAALRLWMLGRLFEVNGDSLSYGGIAKNLLLDGRYALTTANGITYPTLIRLPGYPLFLVVCFRLFGMENYYAAACVQLALELAGCLLLAGFARRMALGLRPGNVECARRAALATLWLAALCPFTASYTAFSLAETPTLFALALAMYAMARFCERPAWPSALAFTFAVTFATLLRPDGALAAIAFAPVMIRAGIRDQRPENREDRGLAREAAWANWRGFREAHRPGALSFSRYFAKKVGEQESRSAKSRTLCIALVCILLALAPFAVWTARNWQVFHVFEPLASRLATDPGEDTNPGWERWVKSWCLDFISTYQIYWNVPDDTLDVNQLPSRAFDSPAQYAETATLARDYNTHGKQLTPDLDARFARLAQERVADHPLRYYVVLPLGRLADMWLRPRVENLPIDLDWWVYTHHRAETRFAWFYAALNAFYLLLALAGLWLRPRFWLPLLAYMLMRSALLLTVEAPETRYTLECFPMIFALGGVAISSQLRRGK